jgi:hypothetical protein
MLPSVEIRCPYCGESIELRVDLLIEHQVDHQRYIEDCQVCCRPIEVTVVVDEAGYPEIRVATEDDG